MHTQWLLPARPAAVGRGSTPFAFAHTRPSTERHAGRDRSFVHFAVVPVLHVRKIILENPPGKRVQGNAFAKRTEKVGSFLFTIAESIAEINSQ